MQGIAHAKLSREDEAIDISMQLTVVGAAVGECVGACVMAMALNIQVKGILCRTQYVSN